jgi:hypothetical protein
LSISAAEFLAVPPSAFTVVVVALGLIAAVITSITHHFDYDGPRRVGFFFCGFDGAFAFRAPKRDFVPAVALPHGSTTLHAFEVYAAKSNVHRRRHQYTLRLRLWFAKAVFCEGNKVA